MLSYVICKVLEPDKAPHLPLPHIVNKEGTLTPQSTVMYY